MIRHYYRLAKPNIIFANAITAAAGFALASRGHINGLLFVAMIIGISLVIACGCVLNNYFDRDIDAVMERTKNRELVQGSISGRAAVIYAVVLGFLGILVLTVYANFLTLCIALLGLFFYVVMYGLWFKRRSSFGTVVGSVSGAVPPLVGYCAASNRIDLGAVILFTIIVVWQMPHFFAIAIYRSDEYAKASIPVLPVKRGVRTTKIYMALYIVAFIVAIAALTAFGYAGYAYLTVMLVLGFAWLGLCIKGFYTKDDMAWARSMFMFSLVIIMALAVMMAAGPLIG